MKKIILAIALMLIMAQADGFRGKVYDATGSVGGGTSSMETMPKSDICEELWAEAWASIFMSSKSETIGEKRDYLTLGVNAARRMRIACYGVYDDKQIEKVQNMIYKMLLNIKGIPRSRPIVAGM